MFKDSPWHREDSLYVLEGGETELLSEKFIANCVSASKKYGKWY